MTDGETVKPRDRFEILREDIHAKLDILTEGWAIMRQDISALKTYAGTVDERLTMLTTEMVALRDDVADLKLDVGILKEDVGALKQDVGILKGDVGRLKEDAGILKFDMNIVKRLVQSHSHKLGELGA